MEKYISFNINNKLAFIDSFLFVSSSLDNLVKNLGKDDYKYLSQEFNSNVRVLARQKGFYPYENMNNFEKFKGQLTSKEKFYSSLISKKITDKEYQHVLKVWDRFEMKARKYFYDFQLNCDALLVADERWSFLNF